VRAEHNNLDVRTLVADLLPLSRGRIPKPDTAIKTARGQFLTVPAEGYRAHTIFVPGQSAPFASGRRIPEFDGTIRARRSQQFSRRLEGHRIDRSGVACEGSQFLSRNDIP